MMSIVTVSFRYTVSNEQFEAENGREIAEWVASFPGLLWKIWLHDPGRRRCEGIYRFESDEAADAYVNGPVVAHLKTAEGYYDIEAVKWDVLAEPSAITRAPGLADVLPVVMSIDPDIRERRWATVAEHIRCEMHGADIDGAIAAFHNGNASYDVVPLMFLSPPGRELTHSTARDVRDHLSYLTTAFPDLELIPERVHYSDDAVIVEGRSTGTHRGEFMGLQPTGRKMDVRACVVYRFDGERMTNETIYFDLATQLRQLGRESMDL